MAASTDIEEFKRTVAEFTKEVNELDERTLEIAWSAVASEYLRIPTDPLSLMFGVMHLQFASKKYQERLTILEYGYDPLQRLKAMFEG